MVTGKSLIGAARGYCPRLVLLGACGLLLLANGFNVGADLAGMAELTEMLVGIPHAWLIPGFGLLILGVMVFATYGQIARQLKWLTLSLFAYVFAAILARPHWGQLLRAAVLPTVRWEGVYWGALVGTLGTTISPYLFFWQASQEVEELQRQPGPPEGREHLLRDSKVDVMTGMFYSNLIMFFIIAATGATLHPAGVRDIETARQAAEALRPLAGDAAYILYALGIIGTGLLAIPVLIGSASYAVAELFGWNSGLSLTPRTASRFYTLLAGGIAVGIGMDLVGLNAIRALFWSAVVNGVAAPPLLVLVLLIGTNPRIMGRHVIGFWLKFFGWASVAIMTAAGLAMFASF